MQTVLFAWIVSMLFCSLFTFVMPAWDAFAARRNAKLNEVAPARNTGRPELTMGLNSKCSSSTAARV